GELEASIMERSGLVDSVAGPVIVTIHAFVLCFAFVTEQWHWNVAKTGFNFRILCDFPLTVFGFIPIIARFCL
ncbi:hypothetical protein, partial [Gilvimarinus sp. 1_MG-2023]|uniref:hypothetical protein n=1 Tax=Gilvimarinus sp. 1_MG-2023 TaxID=3062638 RepID=UPI0026E2F416